MFILTNTWVDLCSFKYIIYMILNISSTYAMKYKPPAKDTTNLSFIGSVHTYYFNDLTENAWNCWMIIILMWNA